VFLNLLKVLLQPSQLIALELPSGLKVAEQFRGKKYLLLVLVKEGQG
jgi:hypothetical protein